MRATETQQDRVEVAKVAQDERNPAIKASTPVTANKQRFWNAIRPQFRAEPDPYGLIARASIMLEDFVSTALAEVWPGGVFPKKVRIDHAERVELLRSLKVWDQRVCDAVSTFTTLRNNAMHKSTVQIDAKTIRSFLTATDYFVRKVEEEEDVPLIPVSDLESEDGIAWILSRHLTAMLGWIYEYELEATYGKTLLLSRVAPDDPFPPIINIQFKSANPAPPPPLTFEEKLRIVSGCEGEAQFARIASFPTFRVDLEYVTSSIEAGHWSRILGDSGIEDPTLVFVYAVRSENNLAIIVISEDNKDLLIRHVEKSSHNSLYRLIPNTAWRALR